MRDKHKQYWLSRCSACHTDTLYTEIVTVIPASLLKKQHIEKSIKSKPEQETSKKKKNPKKLIKLSASESCLFSATSLLKIFFPSLLPGTIYSLCEEITWTQDSSFSFPVFWGLFLSTVAHWANKTDLCIYLSTKKIHTLTLKKLNSTKSSGPFSIILL